MEAKDIVHCALQIERLSADRSYGDILALLGDLDKLYVTSEHLETTDIVKVLYGLLRHCCDDGVKKRARGLLSRWKKVYSQERRGVKSTGGREPELPSEIDEAGDGGVSQERDSHSGCDGCVKSTEQEASPSAAKDGHQTSASSSPVRAKCVQLLLASLRPEPPDEDKAAALARDIEQRVHERHKSSLLKYKSCVRSKVANLRNPKTQHLRRGLLSGSLTAEAFAGMSAEEMAGEELRGLREEYASRGVSERQLPQGVEGTPTHKIRCKRCGGSDCRVTQVSRGALFLPAWVRRGGPDEDAMTFVTCSGCGQQWYHSGWVCL